MSVLSLHPTALPSLAAAGYARCPRDGNDGDDSNDGSEEMLCSDDSSDGMEEIVCNDDSNDGSEEKIDADDGNDSKEEMFASHDPHSVTTLRNPPYPRFAKELPTSDLRLLTSSPRRTLSSVIIFSKSPAPRQAPTYGPYRPA